MVSWNDAADSHESVASDALVMPISSGRPSAGACPPGPAPVGVGEHPGVDPLAGQEVGVAGLLHRDPAGHLAHDQLDVLVVDRHALVAVHPLDLLDQVLLGLPDALDLEQLLGVARALDQRVAGRDLLAVGDLEAGRERDGVGVLAAVVADDGDDAALALVLGHADHARRAGEDGLALGRAGLEQLDHPGQTVGDVASPAIPPVWNVRMVSWVPGSPMDWAAMTPTASPSSIACPVASERP